MWDLGHIQLEQGGVGEQVGKSTRSSSLCFVSQPEVAIGQKSRCQKESWTQIKAKENKVESTVAVSHGN